MPRRDEDVSPWQAVEEQAYHAYREWPVFLRLRLRALREHLPPEAFEDSTSGTMEPDAKPDDAALLAAYGLVVPEDQSGTI